MSCLALGTFAHAEEPEKETRILLLRRNRRVEYIVLPKGGYKRTPKRNNKTDRVTPQVSIKFLPEESKVDRASNPAAARLNQLRQPEIFSGWPSTEESLPSASAAPPNTDASVDHRFASAEPVNILLEADAQTVASTGVSTPIQETQVVDSLADVASNPDLPDEVEQTRIELPLTDEVEQTSIELPLSDKVEQTRMELPLAEQKTHLADRNMRPAEPQQFSVGWVQLTSAHAVGFIFGLLLCLLVLFLVILALLRLLASKPEQTIRMEMNPLPTAADLTEKPLPPDSFGSIAAVSPSDPRPAERETAVVDFATEIGSLEGLGAVYQEEWKAREKENGQQEFSIIEGIVEDNVAFRASLIEAA